MKFINMHSYMREIKNYTGHISAYYVYLSNDPMVRHFDLSGLNDTWLMTNKELECLKNDVYESDGLLNFSWIEIKLPVEKYLELPNEPKNFVDGYIIVATQFKCANDLN